ncbi:hypothetical protein H5410_057621 [Solanum commersonii]|uniref:Uncharacterized protein n=1 Tax=Solanum commersonii TaxID=4109 RepID=A0A9J5WQJ8_SOLCO|nr:hypothetical protein H5410_057621 [Solanum commersonii]
MEPRLEFKRWEETHSTSQLRWGYTKDKFLALSYLPRLEVWRQTLESKGLRLSRTKMEYLECKFRVRLAMQYGS